MPASPIKVTSHVGRDLLASAASFKNEATVVWEYVANSLQYFDPTGAPRVLVDIRPKRKEIVISDNGLGMDQVGLNRFFQMHGENRDRLAGRPGRGKFGTGKSAAFGIGTLLRVDTRRAGLRNVVALSRAAIDGSSGDEIPVEWLVRNEATTEPSGTTVTISGIVLPRIESASVIEYIERHLKAFRGFGPEVAVNEHVCVYREPSISAEYTFQPPEKISAAIGEVKLTVQVSQAPLSETDQGVCITAGAGNMVAIERAGMERKEFGSYLLGTVDVPALESSNSPIQPYDSSRSLMLNPQHPVALALISFIGAKLEEVRLKLVADSRERRKTEQARRLASEANKIADILNADFKNIQQRLETIRAASVPGGAPARAGDADAGGTDGDQWVSGTATPGETAVGAKEVSRGSGSQRPAPIVPTSGTPKKDGDNPVDPSGGRGTRKKPSGGFKVEFRNLGKDEGRSLYDPNALEILINLDNAVVAAALGDGAVENPQFRRLAYEIAFTEYALALGWETTKADPELPANDLLYEVRRSLNRIAIAAAALYRE